MAESKLEAGASRPGPFQLNSYDPLASRDVVLIRNGRKSYGTGKNKKDVLKDINMTVCEGSM